MAKNANQIRIIGGRHRGRRLSFVPVAGLRPTPDRVRETLFNWLQFDIHGARCLDLFAGSGALGLEALSRGAAHVTFIERARAASERLKENLALCRETENSTVLQIDALQYLDDSSITPYDVVFIDPPFADKLLPKVCARLENGNCMAEKAWVYLEQDATHKWPEFPETWHEYRQSNAGQSVQKLIRRDPESSD